MVWYFAYGSNMNPARLADQRLRERAVQMGPRIGGRLDGWRLVFNKVARQPAGAAAGNIVEAPGDVVHGTLNEMPQAGLAVLDIWEGVAGGHYDRRTVRVVRADTGETGRGRGLCRAQDRRGPAADARVSRPPAGRQ
jgi:hypothetical protein